jgi:hypothetical protein
MEKEREAARLAAIRTNDAAAAAVARCRRMSIAPVSEPVGRHL